MLALDTQHLDKNFAAPIRLTDQITASPTNLLELPEDWARWAGTLGQARLPDRGIYLLAAHASQAPLILDAENEGLIADIHKLYWCLLLTVPFMAHEQGVMITGAQLRTELQVRSIQPYSRIPWTPAAPREDVSETHLQTAAGLAQQLTAQLQIAPFERLGRGNHAFYAALQASDWGERTLEFVRAIEALILPPIGRAKEAFTARGQLFVGARHDDTLGQMYDIRSAVVHLHHPGRQLPNIPERERRIIILKRCIQAEAMARYCLAHLAGRARVHRYFQDDQTLEQFWLLTPEARRGLWGPELNLTAPVSDIRDDWLPDDVLGL